MGLRPPANADSAKLFLLLLVTVAFGLRLHQLDYQSLWRDEVDAILFARGSLSELASLFIEPGHNGPLYYVILHAWIRLAGDSEFGVRFFSLVCGVLSVPLMFRLGRWWLGRGGSLLAATLGATSPYLIWYSQDAKMYALLLLLSILSTHVYLLALRRDQIYLWLFYLLTMGISMYVHLLSVLIVPFHALLFLVTWPRHRRAIKSWLAAFAFLALPYLPLLRWEVPILVSPAASGYQVYGLHEILTILLFAFSLNSEPYPGLIPISLFIFLLLAGVFLYWRGNAGPLTLSLKTLFRSREESITLSLHLFVPIVCLYLISLRMPIFTDRYLITALPGFLFLLAFGYLAVKRKSSVLAVACLVLLVMSNLYVVSLQGNTRIKSDFRGAAEHIEEDGRGDLMVFLIPHGRLVFDYYYDDQFSWAEAPFTNGGMNAQEVARVMTKATAGREEVWLVASEAELWDSRGLVKGWFERRAQLSSHASLARVDVYLYSLSS